MADQPTDFEELCLLVRRYIVQEPTEGYESWQDRVDNVLTSIRVELAQPFYAKGEPALSPTPAPKEDSRAD